MEYHGKSRDLKAYKLDDEELSITIIFLISEMVQPLTYESDFFADDLIMDLIFLDDLIMDLIFLFKAFPN